MRDCGFPPIADRRAVVLILGSLPGRKSLEVQQYYAHPRNQFWRIMAGALDEDFDVPYARRQIILKRRGIALWDVLARASRPGSLDSSIVRGSSVANDFQRFFRAHRSVRLVAFNGGKAAECFRRLVLPRLDARDARLQYATLPSTSPAHAALSFDAKLKRWSVVVGRPANDGHVRLGA